MKRKRLLCFVLALTLGVSCTIKAFAQENASDFSDGEDNAGCGDLPEYMQEEGEGFYFEEFEPYENPDDTFEEVGAVGEVPYILPSMEEMEIILAKRYKISEDLFSSEEDLAFDDETDLISSEEDLAFDDETDLISSEEDITFDDGTGLFSSEEDLSFDDETDLISSVENVSSNDDADIVPSSSEGLFSSSTDDGLSAEDDNLLLPAAEGPEFSLTDAASMDDAAGRLSSSPDASFTAEAADESDILSMISSSDKAAAVYTLNIEEGEDLTIPLNYLIQSVKDEATDAKPVRIVIPPGSYAISGTIFLYSNLQLCAKGARITKTTPVKQILMRLGEFNDNFGGGYEGFRNISVEGGTWDLNYASVPDEKKREDGGFVGFRFAHADHLTVKNVNFCNNLKSHFLELGGVRHATVTGCSFSGYWEPYNIGGQECIQIDVCYEYSIPGYPPYDGTACEKIRIEKNTFTHVVAGVGSHSMTMGLPYDGISIIGNSFQDVQKRALRCMNFTNSVIRDNVMTDVCIGVDVESIAGSNAHTVPDGEVPDPYTLDAQVTVSGNEISLCGTRLFGESLWQAYGIRVLGAKPTAEAEDRKTGVYPISHVYVRDNTVEGPGNGILLTLADECELKDNTLCLEKPESYPNLGVIFSASTDNILETNKIEGTKKYGIYLYKGTKKISSPSSGNLIIDNEVQNNGGTGIWLAASSDHVQVLQNRIWYNAGVGIRVVSCRGTDIWNNLIQENGGSGIYTEGKSKALSLLSNKVLRNRSSGIYLTNCKVKALRANQACYNKNYGIYAKDTAFSVAAKNHTYRNGKAWQIYTADSTGLNSLKTPVSALITPKVKYMKGTAKGSTRMLIYRVENNGKVKICAGKTKANGTYSLLAAAQKKNTILLLIAQDASQNDVRVRVKVAKG
ncbi:MAG: right-handed parallel beta-helix repeat-containing protein [Blautia sp.]|nr:right-handed parallel beta-helix repeat-containing protein [Blautia sp.]